MIQIKGSKQFDRTNKDIAGLSQEYTECILDIGTGDGRFIYKSAVENPDKLYIGMDPAAKQLEIYSKKAARKKIYNSIFITGSIEQFPLEEPIFDKVFIILPWGSLLKSVAEPNDEVTSKLSKVIKQNGNLTIIFGYDPKLEPSETERLQLNVIDQKTINEKVIPGFERSGYFELLQQKTLTKELLKEFSTTWSKKLGYGSERPLFQLIFKRC